eukprot:gene1466-1808_t
MDKVFGVFSALGNFGFAYSCAIVLMEVQDTLREPPPAAVSMKKTVKQSIGLLDYMMTINGSHDRPLRLRLTETFLLSTGAAGRLLAGSSGSCPCGEGGGAGSWRDDCDGAVPLSLSVTFALYAAVSVTGYLALGNAVPSSIVLGFDDAPIWVTIMVNLMVLIHLIPAYQVYSQPAFATMEDLLLRAFPKLDKLAGREWTVRLVYRSLYVGMTTVVACALPFF